MQMIICVLMFTFCVYLALSDRLSLKQGTGNPGIGESGNRGIRESGNHKLNNIFIF